MIYGAAQRLAGIRPAAPGDDQHVLLVLGRSICCLPLILQLFPTGKPVSRHWRILVWLTLATAALGNAFVGPDARDYGASSFLVAPWWAMTEGIASAATPIIILASVISLVVRFVRGSETVAPAGAVAAWSRCFS